MWAALGVQAAVREQKPLDGTAVNQMLVDDLRYVLPMHEAVPDRVRVDHHNGAVLALVEAAEFVRPHLTLQPGVFDSFLEGVLQLPAAMASAARPRGVFVALIGADKEVMLKLCHCGISFRASSCAMHPGF
jgi:hypothetical protein